MGGFLAVPIFIDPGGRPLAAWQVELTAEPDGLTLVGVEGGAHPAFAEPAFHDPALIGAAGADRIVLAAFSTADAAALPSARSRVATVMLALPAGPRPSFHLDLVAAADPAGAALPARSSFGIQP